MLTFAAQYHASRCCRPLPQLPWRLLPRWLPVLLLLLLVVCWMTVSLVRRRRLPWDRCQGSLQVWHQRWDHLAHSRCCNLNCKHFRCRVCRLLRTVWRASVCGRLSCCQHGLDCRMTCRCSRSGDGMFAAAADFTPAGWRGAASAAACAAASSYSTACGTAPGRGWAPPCWAASAALQQQRDRVVSPTSAEQRVALMELCHTLCKRFGCKRSF